MDGSRVVRGLPIGIDHGMASLTFSQLSELASAYRLSVYDAAYLELAERRTLALACKDGPLRKAAKRRGLVLWQELADRDPPTAAVRDLRSRLRARRPKQ
jgi:hypothetical protein